MKTKPLALIAVLAVALTAAACGGSSDSSSSSPTTTNAAQQQQVAAAGSAIQTDGAQLQAGVAKCEGAADPMACFGPIVSNYGDDINTYAKTLSAVANEVSGSCQTGLNNLSNQLASLGDSFEQLGLNLTNMAPKAAVAKLTSLDSQAQQVEQSAPSSVSSCS